MCKLTIFSFLLTFLFTVGLSTDRLSAISPAVCSMVAIEEPLVENILANEDAPFVITGDAHNVQSSSALLTAKVVSDGGMEITDRGFFWGTDPDLVYQGAMVSCGPGTGTFTHELTQLEVNTTYYFSAFATNSDGTSLGEINAFTTLAELPVVVTAEATGVTVTEATLAGKVGYDGGADIIEQGWFLSTTPDTVINGQLVPDETGESPFVIHLSDLEHNTTYYFSAFAINMQGTGIGEVQSFTTLVDVPGVITIDPDEITYNSAILGGEIIYTGGDQIIEKGIYLDTVPDVFTDDGIYLIPGDQGIFLDEFFDLKPNTTWYFAAFASNGTHTGTGEIKSFHTPATVPEVITLEPTDVTSGSAIAGGRIIADGGIFITEKGIMLAEDENFTYPRFFLSATNSDTSFELGLTSLDEDQVYYYTAFASNNAGISYGDTLAFRTESLMIIKHLPNAFMPGSHLEENQVYKPIFREFPGEYTLAVFNRWGTRVFLSHDPESGWDGQFQNKDAPQGGYIYKLEYTNATGKKHQRSGTLMLLR